MAAMRRIADRQLWAVYGRLSVGKGLFEHSAVAGWCGHVSDL